MSNTEYVVVDSTTGIVAHYGDVPSKNIPLIAKPGQTVVLGVWPVGTRWDGTNWVPIEIPLEEFKRRKNLEINAARQRANSTYFVFATKQIACDPLSRGDIDGIQGKVARTGTFPVNFPNAWKALDNTWVAIPDVATWDSFYDAMLAQGTTNFAHAQSLKQLLAAATTVAEINAITW